MMPAPPLRNVLDDVEVLSRPDVAESPRLGREGGQRGSVLQTPLERGLLPLQPPHGRDAGGALRPRVEVVVQRPVVEEPDQDERRHREPATRDRTTDTPAASLPRSHPAAFLRRAPRSCGYWTTSTLITLVVPGMFTAVPAVITTLSPVSTIPASRAASTARRQSSSTSLVSEIRSGVTPHSSESWRIAQSTCVSATTGRRGRSRATAFAVRPVNVGTRIAAACRASAMSQAAFDIACPIVGFSWASGSSCR